MINIISIFLDGGVKDGYMYIGILSTSKTLPIKFSKKLGQGSSHIAEEQALYHCINILKNLSLGNNEIILYSDQETLVTVINNDDITAKAAKTFPKSQEIKNFITKSNVKIEWVQGTKNLAHTLMNDAYNGIFFNDVSPNCEKTSSQTIPIKEVDTISYIQILQKEIVKKDNLINDLMKVITKLNNSTINI